MHVVRPDTITCVLELAVHYIILLAIAIINLYVVTIIFLDSLAFAKIKHTKIYVDY